VVSGRVLVGRDQRAFGVHRGGNALLDRCDDARIGKVDARRLQRGARGLFIRLRLAEIGGDIVAVLLADIAGSPA
jgi:hypothetical protein